MSEQDKPFQHSFDGIQEYDNNLPSWWIGLFWVTIIFSAGYAAYYHLGPGLSQERTLAKEMALAAEKQLAKAGAAEVNKEPVLLALVSKTEIVDAGKQVYAARCLPCHGAAGQGVVGPNLTDDYWIHGGKITDIKKVVSDGVLSKGMLAWKSLLPEKEIDAVVAYIWNLHGTNPPAAKAPEGQHLPRT